jgi:hypothetical protein
MKLIKLLTYLTTLIIYSVSKRLKKALMNCPPGQIMISFITKSDSQSYCGTINLSSLDITFRDAIVPNDFSVLSPEYIHHIEFKVEGNYRVVTIHMPRQQRSLVLKNEIMKDTDEFMKKVFSKYNSWFFSHLRGYYNEFAKDEFSNIDEVEQRNYIIENVGKITQQMRYLTPMYREGDDLKRLILNCSDYLEFRKLDLNYYNIQNDLSKALKEDLMEKIKANWPVELENQFDQSIIDKFKSDCDDVFKRMENPTRRKYIK